MAGCEGSDPFPQDRALTPAVIHPRVAWIYLLPASGRHYLTLRRFIGCLGSDPFSQERALTPAVIHPRVTWIYLLPASGRHYPFAAPGSAGRWPAGERNALPRTNKKAAPEGGVLVCGNVA